MASSTASVLNRGKPPVLIEGVASTTLTLGSSSNYRVNSASGSQSVTTINLPNVRAGYEIVLIGTSDSNYLSLATGGNIKVPVTRALLNGVAIQLKYDGTYWCEMGSGIDSAGAATTLLDGLTAGTIVASKAVTVDSNKDASAFRNVVLTNLDAGASGTAGSVDVFPSTASKGKIAIAATNNTNNDTTTITNAAQGGAYTYTIPDAGASTEFVMSAGTATIAGAKTWTLFQTFAGATYHTNGIAAGSLIRKISTSVGGGGLEEYCIKSGTVALGTTALTTSGIDIGADIPAGATIKMVALRIVSGVTGAGTSAKIGVGISGTPSAYGLTAGLTTAGAINLVPYSHSASLRDVKVYPCETGGAIGDTTLSTGSISWMVVYETVNTAAI